ncbi:MAG: hypothetical protein ACRD2L_13680, partial [Terriglobia bacterium]
MTQHWRYYIPSIDGEGWAVVFMDSAGSFSTVGDFGNFGHVWNAIGPCRDVREFICDIQKDWHYISRKLGTTTQELDGPKTKQKIIDYIDAECPSEDERELVSEADFSCKEGFDAWCHETELDEAFLFGVWSEHNSAEQFAKQVIP